MPGAAHRSARRRSPSRSPIATRPSPPLAADLHDARTESRRRPARARRSASTASPNAQQREAVVAGNRSSQSPPRTCAPARRPPARRAPSRRRTRRASGVLSGDCASTVGTDSRPLLTSVRANGWCCASASTASRNVRDDRALGRDEVGGARRVADVLVGGRDALARRRCRAARRARGRAAPASSFQTRLSASCTPLFAPRAPNGDTQMRRVAGEQHAAVAEVLHAPALERVDARPFDLELARRAPSMRAQARQDVLGLASPPRGRRPSRAGSRRARRRRPGDAAAPIGCGWNGGSNQNQRSAGKVRRPCGCRRSGSGRGTPGPSLPGRACGAPGCARRRRRRASRTSSA